VADPERELLHGLIEELREQLRISQRDNARLRHQVDQLARRLYGRRTERVDPNQGELDLGPDPETPAEDEARRAPETEEEFESTQERTRRGRKQLPKDLPRKRIVLEPEATDLICPGCEGEKRRIGSDITEELEYEPAVLYINEYERPKYACPRCEHGVAQAALPARPIEKGRPGPGLLAHVVVSKYSEHLPLYRQETVFPRSGVDISRRTLCDWVRAVADLGAPIVTYMKTESVLTSKVIHSDDTRITVQDPRLPGGSRPGYLWVYGGDHEDLVYDFTPSRSRDGPLAFLGDYADRRMPTQGTTKSSRRVA